MLSRTVLVTGLLLYITHIAKSYILLSANIEDVKKIARKFLSEDVVQQLSALAKKINKEIAANLSEENKINEESINNVSEESEDLTSNDLRTRRYSKRDTTIHDRLSKFDMGKENNNNWNYHEHLHNKIGYKNKLTTKRNRMEDNKYEYERQNKDDRDNGMDDETLVLATSGDMKLPKIKYEKQSYGNIWDKGFFDD